MAKMIPLTKGYVTTVDDCDYESLNLYRWKALIVGKKVYAARTVKSPGSKRNDITILMHRVIHPGAVRVDHKNGDGLDNQRQNLRSANASQNAANSPIVVRGTSRFKGVYWNKHDRRWQAQIGHGRGAVKYLGQFKDERNAALAYDAAAIERFGEFAVLNFSRCPIKGPSYSPANLKPIIEAQQL